MEAEGIDADETEDLPDLPDLPEEEALYALLARACPEPVEAAEAVRDHDRWPKELYWGGI